MKQTRNLLPILLCLTALAAPAADFEKGMAAYERGDYATALREWQALAEQGLAAAQNSLGVMYDQGLGVVQDDKEAVKWYRRAAEQGNDHAQHNLGVMYDEGQGVARNYRMAAKWWQLAAEQGDAGAQNNLGFMYDKGRGVPQDYIRAHLWYNLAAAQGHELAAENRDLLAEEMRPADITTAQQLARECVERNYKGC